MGPDADLPRLGRVEAAYDQLDAAIEAFKRVPGHACAGPERCWRRFARWTRWARSATASGTSRRCSTTRISANNEINARRQQVQILFARQQQAGSWFNPELLAIPLETVRGWLDANAELARLPVRDREPVPRAGARARRAGRAADVVRGALQQRPARQLLRADDRRHEVSVDHAGTAASR